MNERGSGPLPCSWRLPHPDHFIVTMTPADGIRRLGFHRWYERQLIESHVYLVTGLLSRLATLR